MLEDKMEEDLVRPGLDPLPEYARTLLEDCHVHDPNLP
jgi:hypothetical protein